MDGGHKPAIHVFTHTIIDYGKKYDRSIIFPSGTQEFLVAYYKILYFTFPANENLKSTEYVYYKAGCL